MNKAILTSAAVAAFFGFGMDANAEYAGGKTAAHTPAAHSHLTDAFEDYPRKDASGHTTYQSEVFEEMDSEVFVDADGRASYYNHWEDSAMEKEVGSPMGLEDRYDNPNTPTVK
jgi:hypothetical protein